METTNQVPKKKGRTVLRIFLFLILAGAIVLGAILFSFGRYDDQKLHNDPQTTLVYDAGGNLALSAHGTQDRVAVPIGEIPQSLRDAVLAAEDLRFYEHVGFDIVRIFAEPFSRNRASCRVLEKAGFVHEGTLRKNAIKNGEFIDMEMYSLI